MNTLEAIKTRRAVRAWLDKNIPEDILHSILEAGRWAPSPLNSHPWQFIVIRNKATFGVLQDKANHGSFLSGANVVIVVVVDKNAKVDSWLAGLKQHIFSGVCALENMWLAAWDLGLGGCWVSLNEQTTRQVLSIPDTYELIGSLALGYPAEVAKLHEESDRRPLSEMVSNEKFMR